ncbi:hypothetical protein AK812_SmicGene651 [Symbiodinium microadriaticum]|uniref:Uncharacterized protein n=1 Tax=Symbiodinium microadriaticum TaxID=2951 RepID=A0A1Q9F5V0_SYMMI|nr:hypothetical protein AK812_SmicGene651 [Symbiodinium microadriaticum]
MNEWLSGANERENEPRIVVRFAGRGHLAGYEVAAATLCSAGLRAACAALRTCKGWSEDAISLGCRERAYTEMTGATYRGLSAPQLADFMLTRQPSGADISALTGGCSAGRVDGSVIFAILRSGEALVARDWSGKVWDKRGQLAALLGAASGVRLDAVKDLQTVDLHILKAIYK